MNKKIGLLGVIFLAFIFTIGIFYIMPTVHADDDGNSDNGDDHFSVGINGDFNVSIDDNDNGNSDYDDSDYDDSDYEDSDYEDSDYEDSDYAYQNNTNLNSNINSSLLDDSIKLNVRFTPAQNIINENGTDFVTIYDFSKIHLNVISNAPLKNNEYQILLKMTLLSNNDPEVPSTVYLKLDNLVSTSAGNINDSVIDLDVDSNFESSNKIESEDAEVYIAINSVSSINSQNINPEQGRKAYKFNYTISFSNNKDEIVSTFGKDYKDQNYSLDISLKLINETDASNATLASENFMLSYGSSNEVRSNEYTQNLMRERVRISTGEVNSEFSDEINQLKTKSVVVKSFLDSEILIDENTNEIYISNKDKIRKILSVNDVLALNNITAENVIGNLDLVSVDDNPEYVFKVKERKKLLWIIPFGYKEKLVSLNATNQIQVDANVGN